MGVWRNNFSGPGTIILKAAFLCNNSTRNSLLIHGFWPVNARLLIVYGTAFYAIMQIHMTSLPIHSKWKTGMLVCASLSALCATL